MTGSWIWALNEFLLWFGGCFVLLSFWLVARGRMHTRYGLWWGTSGGGCVLLGWTGIETPSELFATPSTFVLILFVLGLLVCKALLTDIALSRKELQVRRLSQKLALLEVRFNADKDTLATFSGQVPSFQNAKKVAERCADDDSTVRCCSGEEKHAGQ